MCPAASSQTGHMGQLRGVLSEGDHVMLAAQLGEHDGVHEGGILALQVVGRHPTGDGARASNIYGHFGANDLGHQLLEGRKAYPVHAVANDVANEVGAFTHKGQGALDTAGLRTVGYGHTLPVTSRWRRCAWVLIVTFCSLPSRSCPNRPATTAWLRWLAL